MLEIFRECSDCVCMVMNGCERACMIFSLLFVIFAISSEVVVPEFDVCYP